MAFIGQKAPRQRRVREDVEVWKLKRSRNLISPGPVILMLKKATRKIKNRNLNAPKFWFAAACFLQPVTHEFLVIWASERGRDAGCLERCLQLTGVTPLARFISTGFCSRRTVRLTSGIQKLLHAGSHPQTCSLKDTFPNASWKAEPGKCFADIFKMWEKRPHDEEEADKLPGVLHTAVSWAEPQLLQILKHPHHHKEVPIRTPEPTEVQAAAYKAHSMASLVHR